MTIAGIQSGQSVYNNFFALEGGKSKNQQSVGNTVKPDTVQISYEARALAEAAEVQKNIPAGVYSEQAGIPEEVLEGLKMFSIPGWMGEFTPKHAMADKTMGQPYLESNGALRDSLSPSGKEDLGEYMNTLHQHYSDELKDRDLTSIEFNKLRFLDDSLSEEVHKAVSERLAADSRAMELMQLFGVTL